MVRCAFCGMKISPGVREIQAIQLQFHENCFQCSKCKKVIGSGQFIEGNIAEVFCLSCGGKGSESKSPTVVMSQNSSQQKVVSTTYSNLDTKLNCLSCRNPLSSTAKFCPVCGTQVSKTCLNCKGELKPESKFCGSCGKKQ